MFKNFKISYTVFVIAEVVVFYVLARLGRNLLDGILEPLGLAPALVVAARIGFVVLLIVLAVVFDRLVFKAMSKKGWIQ